MKKLLVFLLLVFIKLSGFSQELLDFKATIDTVKVGSKIQLNINVEITGGTPDYKVFYLDGIPGKGKVVANAEKISDVKYLISNIHISNYYVCVVDSKQKLLCKPHNALNNIQK